MVLTDEGEQALGELEIYSMQGRKVFSTVRDHHHLQVNLQALESGVYLVVIRTGNKGFNTKQLLVVQH